MSCQFTARAIPAYLVISMSILFGWSFVVIVAAFP